MTEKVNIYETLITKESPWTHTTPTGEVWNGKVKVHCDFNGKPINRTWIPRNEKERVRARHWDDLYQDILDEYNEKNAEIVAINRAWRKKARLQMLEKIVAQQDEEHFYQIAEGGIPRHHLPEDNEEPNSPAPTQDPEESE